MPPLKIMLSSGEVSGDVQGAYLAQELKKISPGLKLLGAGGERMREAGVEVKIDLTPHGVVGLTETLGHLLPLSRLFSKLKRLMKTERPDLMVLIDYPGFNLKLAGAAKAEGIPVVYYVGPPDWWLGHKRGIQKTIRRVDLMIAIFEKEAEAYKEAGGEVAYFGHPVLEVAKPALSKEEAVKAFGVDPSRPVIGLFPGSRRQEIDSLLPVFLRAAKLIKESRPEVQFPLSVSSPLFERRIQKLISGFPDLVKPVREYPYDVLNISDLILAASGTVTLEAVCLGAPMVIAYQLSPLTYFIAKHILKIQLPFIGLPNLLAGREIVPEIIQQEVNPARLCAEALALLKDQKRRERMKEEFLQIKSRLGPPGAARKAAERILKMAERSKPCS